MVGCPYDWALSVDDRAASAKGTYGFGSVLYVKEVVFIQGYMYKKKDKNWQIYFGKIPPFLSYLYEEHRKI